MKRLTRDHKVYSFSSHHEPALHVEPGEEFVIETHDARSGTIRTPADLLDKPHPDGMNPVTGPVFVNSASPGNTLCVHVLNIHLGRRGFTAIKRNTGLLANKADRYVTRIIPIENGSVRFSETIAFPAKPMIGTIGVAPASETISSAFPGPHGGNMDNNEIRPGSKLHLPVFTEGGRLFLGDVHASMGDGEISMVGLDIAADVTLRVDVLRDEPIERPWIETSDGIWVTTGDDPDLAEALRIASEQMVRLLMKKLSLSFEEAYMLATIRADIGICQCCAPGAFPTTTRMSFAPPNGMEQR